MKAKELLTWPTKKQNLHLGNIFYKVPEIIYRRNMPARILCFHAENLKYFRHELKKFENIFEA